MWGVIVLYMTLNGFIKLHRKILDWQWWSTPRTAHLFVHLLSLASNRECGWKGEKLRAGQVVTGLLSLSKQTGISVRGLRTALTHLKSTGEVTIKTTNKYSIITILKWGQYQITDKQTDNQTTTSGEVKNNTYTTSPQKARGVSTNKTEMRTIDERKFSDEYGSVIDTDGNPIAPSPKTGGSKAMWELIRWAEQERGAKFPAKFIPRQFAAIKSMKASGIKRASTIKERWEELAGQKFYRDNGLDFTSVLSSFSRKPHTNE